MNDLDTLIHYDNLSHAEHTLIKRNKNCDDVVWILKMYLI